MIDNIDHCIRELREKWGTGHRVGGSRDVRVWALLLIRLASVPNSDTLFVWGSQFGWHSRSGDYLMFAKQSEKILRLNGSVKLLPRVLLLCFLTG